MELVPTTADDNVSVEETLMSDLKLEMGLSDYGGSRAKTRRSVSRFVLMFDLKFHHLITKLFIVLHFMILMNSAIRNC